MDGKKNQRKWSLRVALAACIAVFTVFGTMAFIYFNHQNHVADIAQSQLQNLPILEQAKSILGVVIFSF